MNRAIGCILIALLVLSVVHADDSKGFVPLFNGRNFAGWKGDTEAFFVATNKQGVAEIRSVPMKWGDLYTRKQYSDFILRFEYSVGEYGNNGIGLRVNYPCRSASFDGGFQIVLRDDLAYIGQETWRNDASIYGVMAAKNSAAKAPDKWNREEIVLKGGMLSVSVNGVEVLKANLDALSPADGKTHRGLRNRKGHIALLSRKSNTAVRNLQIKELGTE